MSLCWCSFDDVYVELVEMLCNYNIKVYDFVWVFVWYMVEGICMVLVDDCEMKIVLLVFECWFMYLLGGVNLVLCLCYSDVDFIGG